MAAKIDSPYSCVEFFQIFGHYFVDLKKARFGSRREKFFAYFGYAMYFIKWLILTLILIHYLFKSKELIFRENYLKMCLIWWFYPYGITTLLLSFWYRQTDWKYWKILSQIDELMVKFLKVPINTKRFKRIKNLLFGSFTAFVVLITLRMFRKSPLKQHRPDYYSAAIKFIAISTQLSLMKFVVYVYIITNRLQHLLNCKVLSEDNFIVFQNILSKLWMMSKKVEKIFGFQMIMYGISIIISVISSGHFLVIHIFTNNISFEPFFYVLIPIITNFMISSFCQNCMNKVRFTFLTVKRMLVAFKGLKLFFLYLTVSKDRN